MHGQLLGFEDFSAFFERCVRMRAVDELRFAKDVFQIRQCCLRAARASLGPPYCLSEKYFTNDLPLRVMFSLQPRKAEFSYVKRVRFLLDV